MADSLYRRCGCRTESHKAYGPLPERATDAQRAAACPTLLRDSKHGTWGFAVSAGTDPGSGKRLQVRRMGFETKREAQQERAAVIGQVASGRFRGGEKTTMATYLPQWLDRRVNDGMRPSTERMYRSYVDNDIVPSIGAIKLTDLRRFHVDAFVQKLRAEGRGATSIRRIHATLSSALSAAEKLGMVDFNAAAKIALPATNRTKTRVWEPDQVRTFLDLASEWRLGPVFELALFTGLRRGELAGLRWSDVDMVKRELVVKRQRVHIGNAVVEGDVKTDSGQDRRVSLGGEAIGALVAWQIRQASEQIECQGAYTDSGYVFTYEDGRPLRPHLLSQTFDRIVSRSDLPHMSLHGLRHQHASLMLSGGVDIAVVSKRLGHSTITVTSDLYSHLLADANRSAADAAESMLPAKTPREHTLHTRGR